MGFLFFSIWVWSSAWAEFRHKRWNLSAGVVWADQKCQVSYSNLPSGSNFCLLSFLPRNKTSYTKYAFLLLDCSQPVLGSQVRCGLIPAKVKQQGRYGREWVGVKKIIFLSFVDHAFLIPIPSRHKNPRSLLHVWFTNKNTVSSLPCCFLSYDINLLYIICLTSRKPQIK